MIPSMSSSIISPQSAADWQQLSSHWDLLAGKFENLSNDKLRAVLQKDKSWLPPAESKIEKQIWLRTIDYGRLLHVLDPEQWLDIFVLTLTRQGLVDYPDHAQSMLSVVEHAEPFMLSRLRLQDKRGQFSATLILKANSVPSHPFYRKLDLFPKVREMLQAIEKEEKTLEMSRLQLVEGILQWATHESGLYGCPLQESVEALMKTLREQLKEQVQKKLAQQCLSPDDIKI